jgi:hypothetical protein
VTSLAGIVVTYAIELNLIRELRLFVSAHSEVNPVDDQANNRANLWVPAENTFSECRCLRNYLVGSTLSRDASTASTMNPDLHLGNCTDETTNTATRSE